MCFRRTSSIVQVEINYSRDILFKVNQNIFRTILESKYYQVGTSTQSKSISTSIDYIYYPLLESFSYSKEEAINISIN